MTARMQSPLTPAHGELVEPRATILRRAQDERREQAGQRLCNRPGGCNCSRLRGRDGLRRKFRTWLPLQKRANGPYTPTSLNNYVAHAGPFQSCGNYPPARPEPVEGRPPMVRQAHHERRSRDFEKALGHNRGHFSSMKFLVHNIGVAPVVQVRNIIGRRRALRSSLAEPFSK